MRPHGAAAETPAPYAPHCHLYLRRGAPRISGARGGDSVAVTAQRLQRSGYLVVKHVHIAPPLATAAAAAADADAAAAVARLPSPAAVPRAERDLGMADAP